MGEVTESVYTAWYSWLTGTSVFFEHNHECILILQVMNAIQ